jgi:hypothetical protein
MAGFLFRLETSVGVPAEPPTLTSAVAKWRVGDTIPIESGRSFRVIEIRDDDEAKPPTLIVEEEAS